MKTMNILLIVDGTAEGYAAAETAWQLAQKNDAKVKAIQIMDTSKVWKSMAPGEVGLIGSGPYLSAYEAICGEIRKLAGAVEVAYDSRIYNSENLLQCVTKEGEITQVLAVEAQDCDLIIAGQSSILIAPVLSTIKKPLLLVRRRSASWSTTRVLLSHRFPSEATISKIKVFTNSLDARMEFYCYASQQHREECIDKTRQLSAAMNGPVPPSQIPLLFHETNDVGAAWRAEMAVQEDTLVLVPVVDTGNYVLTSLGTEIDKFVKHCQLPVVVLWPCNELVAPTEINAYLADRLRARG